MEQSQSIAKISKALSKFRKAVKDIPQRGKNEDIGNTYATLSDTWETITEALNDNQLSVTQLPDGKGLTTQLMHESGEWIRATTELYMRGQTSHAHGGAITYMRRYALSALLGLATEADDDGNAATLQFKSRITCQRCQKNKKLTVINEAQANKTITAYKYPLCESCAEAAEDHQHAQPEPEGDMPVIQVDEPVGVSGEDLERVGGNAFEQSDIIEEYAALSDTMDIKEIEKVSRFFVNDKRFMSSETNAMIANFIANREGVIRKDAEKKTLVPPQEATQQAYVVDCTDTPEPPTELQNVKERMKAVPLPKEVKTTTKKETKKTPRKRPKPKTKKQAKKPEPKKAAKK